ncbi:hypothetical protein CQW23_23282 [Capsicum baccatum]|uniref:Uncharacterized protein n=1 Tax=Capsicum baccatum TaxID=33114 RepID=A0A2G2VRI8_CAPBA|nr:hypothetical protein CQW23_23282 [Capsicum baccatum]
MGRACGGGKWCFFNKDTENDIGSVDRASKNSEDAPPFVQSTAHTSSPPTVQPTTHTYSPSFFQPIAHTYSPPTIQPTAHVSSPIVVALSSSTIAPTSSTVAPSESIVESIDGGVEIGSDVDEYELEIVVTEYLPNAEHRMCARHVLANCLDIKMWPQSQNIFVIPPPIKKMPGAPAPSTNTNPGPGLSAGDFPSTGPNAVPSAGPSEIPTVGKGRVCWQTKNGWNGSTLHTKWMHNSQYVNCKLERNDNGSYIVRISATSTLVVAELRRPLELLVRGKIVQKVDITLTIVQLLFTREGIKIMSIVHRETGSYIHLDKHSLHVRIFGSSDNVYRAEQRFIDSLLALLESKQLEVHLRRGLMPPNLMKRAVTTFGIDLSFL